jgi:hypothetical protein
VFRFDIDLAAANGRQAALRRPAGLPRRRDRSSTVRRRLGAWIVRLGRAVAGRPSTSPALRA